MKTLLKLEQEYQKTKSELVTSLEGFVDWLVELPDKKGLEIQELKWSLSYGEEYESHYFHKNTVTIKMAYYASWEDDQDSHSSIHVPYTWVAAYHNGNKESVEQEIIDAYVAYNHECIENEKNVVRFRAIELGLIEEQGMELVQGYKTFNGKGIRQ